MAQTLFASDATPSLVDLDANFTELYNTSLRGSGSAIGYTTGSGGTVTQATSKSTAVTLNKVCGRITMNNAALAAGARVSFQVLNSLVAAADSVIATAHDNLNYEIQTAVSGAGGSFYLTIKNATGGSLGEALAINFIIIKGAIS